MKQITIAARLRPYSHTPGEQFLFPETDVIVRVFPTRLVLQKQDHPPVIFDFPLSGPISPFTAQLDLTRKELRIFGMAKEGYFSFCLIQKEMRLVLVIEKMPACTSFSKGSMFPLLEITNKEIGRKQGRLSFGVHKAQEWSQMKKRKDLAELLPLWISLGWLCPCSSSRETKGAFSLLSHLEQQIAKKEKKGLEEKIVSFFLASFQGVFVPQKKDEEYQGIVQGEIEGSPLSLLTKSSSLLASLFYQETEEGIFLLPCLLSLFPAGRWIEIPLEKGGFIHFEWTKMKLRRVLISAGSQDTITLFLPKEIASCRITGKKGRIKTGKIEQGALLLSFAEEKSLSLDRFN